MLVLIGEIIRDVSIAVTVVAISTVGAVNAGRLGHLLC